ncbi:MAG: tetratricopeptide repeat protein [Planctomycetota bacterium]|jgi:hypothetical protein
MKKTIVAMAFAGILLGLGAPSFAEEGEAARELERGFFKEQAERDLEGAIKIYEGLVEKHTSDRAVVAKALLRMGLCLEKLGRMESAVASIERIVDEFGDQKREVDEARKILKRIDPASGTKPVEEGSAPEGGSPEESMNVRHIRAVLENETISLDFRDATLPDVLSFLRTTKSLNIVADPKVLTEFEQSGRTINLSVEDLKLGDAIAILLRFNNLQYEFLHDVMYIAFPGDLTAYKALPWYGDPSPKRKDPRLLGRKVSFDFSGRPLGETVRAMGRHWDIEPDISPGAREHLKESVGTYRVESTSPGDALERLLTPHSLGFAIRAGRVWIATPAELKAHREKRKRILEGSESVGDQALLNVLQGKLISVDFLDTPLEAILNFLSEVSGLNILMGPSVPTTGGESGIRVTLKADELLLEQVLRVILMPLDLEYRIDYGVVTVERREKDLRVEKKTPLEFLRAALESTTDVNLKDASLPLVLDYLSRVSGVSIFLDPRARESAEGKTSVTLNRKGITVKAALEEVTKNRGLGFDLLHGVIYVNRSKALQEDLAVQWYGDQPSLHVSGLDMKALYALRVKKITMALESARLSHLIDTVARLSGVEIVASPRAAEAGCRWRVTCRIANLSAEDALRLLLTPYGLGYRIEKGVVTIGLRETR